MSIARESVSDTFGNKLKVSDTVSKPFAYIRNSPGGGVLLICLKRLAGGAGGVLFSAEQYQSD